MKKKASSILMLLLLVVVTALVLTVYRVALNFYAFEVILAIYMLLTAGLILAYVIYNRGFSRRGVTPEMLPADWSEEKKLGFIEDGKRRMRRSRWLLIPILAFLITFSVDLVELYVVPFFQNMFGG